MKRPETGTRQSAVAPSPRSRTPVGSQGLWLLFVDKIDEQLRRALPAAVSEDRIRVLPALTQLELHRPVVVVTGDAGELGAALGVVASLRPSPAVIAVGRCADRAWVRSAIIAGAIMIVDESEAAARLDERVIDAARGLAVLPLWFCREIVACPTADPGLDTATTQ